MIRYSLSCVGGHEFEAWFSNSAGYDAQRKKRQIECPECGYRQRFLTGVRKQTRSVPRAPDCVEIRALLKEHGHLSGPDPLGHCERFKDAFRRATGQEPPQ